MSESGSIWQEHGGLLVLLVAGAGVLLLLTVAVPGAWATPRQSPVRQTVPPSQAVYGTVFEDLDQNGSKDWGEPGIAGVSITLTGPSTFSTTLTNRYGEYQFLSLTGGDTYTVTEKDPEGYSSSTPNVVSGITVPEIGPGAQVDFGDYLPGPTNTPTSTSTPTETPTGTSTHTPTPTNTSTNTPSPTSTSTPTETPTGTLTDTPTPSPSPTETSTHTPTPTSTLTDTPTGTLTDTPTPTETPTGTSTQTSTPTNTPTKTSTATSTSTPTKTPTGTLTDTPTPTLSPTPTGVKLYLPTVLLGAHASPLTNRGTLPYVPLLLRCQGG